MTRDERFCIYHQLDTFRRGILTNRRGDLNIHLALIRWPRLRYCVNSESCIALANFSGHDHRYWVTTLSSRADDH